jgi:hypothetical protein
MAQDVYLIGNRVDVALLLRLVDVVLAQAL